MNNDTPEKGNTAVLTPTNPDEAAPSVTTAPPEVPTDFAIAPTADRPNEGPVSAQEFGNLKPLGQAPTLPTSEAPAFPQAATATETPAPTPFGQVSEPTPNFNQAAEQPVGSSWTPGASPDSTNTTGDQIGTGELGAGEEKVRAAPVSGTGLPPPAELPTQPVAAKNGGLMKTLFGWTGLVKK